MDFSKIKTWMKKMHQILDLYEENEAFTLTEKQLLLDYNTRIHNEINKLKIIEEEAEEFESMGHIKERNIHVEQFVNIESPKKSEAIKKEENSIESNVIPTEELTMDLYPQLFDHLEVHDIYSKLELKPLQDIKSGMGLNEKILAQNELFNGDKAAFDEVIQHLNQCSDFNSAKNYLCQHVIPKYNWSNASKEKTVDSFIKLVKRRHL